MFISPRTLYEQEDFVSVHYSRGQVDEALDALESAMQQPDIPAAMDELQLRDFDLSHRARTIMAYLPSETIVQAYGGDTLAWLAVRSVMSGDIESKFADAERLAGYDRDLLWKSRQWCGEKLSWQARAVLC